MENNQENVTPEVQNENNFQNKLNNYGNKEVLEKVLFGAVALLSLVIMYIFYKVSDVAFVMSEGMGNLSNLAYVIEGLSTLSFIHGLFRLLLVLILAVLVFNYVKSENKSNFFKESGNILVAATLGFAVLTEFLARDIFKMVGIADKISKGRFFDIAALKLQPEDYEYLSSSTYQTVIVIAYVLLLVAALAATYALYLAIFKKEEFKLGFLKNNSKKIAIVVGALIAAFVAYKSVVAIFTSDAKVSSNIEVRFNATGFDGTGKVEAYVSEYPEVLEAKDQKTKDKVAGAIFKGKVTLDKSEGLKNGDKVTATFEFTKPEGLDIEMENDKITREYTVEGLERIVNNYTEIPEKSKERIQPFVEERIKSSVYNGKNLTLEKVKVLERKQKADDMRSAFELVYIYKVTYDVPKAFSDETEKVEVYKVVNVNNFKLEGDLATYYANVSREVKTSDVTLPELESVFTAQGLEEVVA